MSFVSQPGHYVGRGNSVTEIPPSTIGLNLTADRLHLDAVVMGDSFWGLSITSPSTSTLDIARYQDAARQHRYYESGLDFFGDGRGCNEAYGEFRIRELVLSTSDPVTVESLAVDFVHRCDDDPTAPYLLGMIRVNADEALSAFEDEDSDGVPDLVDTCPQLAAVDQTDSDGDGIGNACDPFPDDSDNLDACLQSRAGSALRYPASLDADGDKIPDADDLCADTAADAPVDGNGCSPLQFCRNQEAVSVHLRPTCRRADWRGDEPGTQAADCAFLYRPTLVPGLVSHEVCASNGNFSEGVSAVPAPRTYLSFVGDPGAFVGRSLHGVVASDDTVFTPQVFASGAISVEAGDGIERWWIVISAPEGSSLAPGNYARATRWPFNSDRDAGLTIDHNSGGCNALYGEFNVLELTYGPGGEVASLAVDAVQHCEYQPDAVRISLRYNSSVGSTQELFDTDNDGVLEGIDNCASAANPEQDDTDGDGSGDACDLFPLSADHLAACLALPAAAPGETSNVPDDDQDGKADWNDRCPATESGAAVDADGCSKDQFCSQYGGSATDRDRRCRLADWQNDKTGHPRDCKPEQITDGFECVPRGS